MEKSGPCENATKELNKKCPNKKKCPRLKIVWENFLKSYWLSSQSLIELSRMTKQGH